MKVTICEKSGLVTVMGLTAEQVEKAKRVLDVYHDPWVVDGIHYGGGDDLAVITPIEGGMTIGGVVAEVPIERMIKPIDPVADLKLVVQQALDYEEDSEEDQDPDED